jgi:hypothetical protein
MPYAEKINDLHGRPIVNVVSSATFLHLRPEIIDPIQVSELDVSEGHGRRNQSSSGQNRQQVLHSKRESMQQQDDGTAHA